MKKILLFLAFCCVSIAQAQTDPIINFPDANLKAKLLALKGLDANKDGEIQESEAMEYKYNYSKYGNSSIIDVSKSNISDMTGIQYFGKFSKTDTSNVSSLQIDCSGNNIMELDLSDTTFFGFNCSNNKISKLILNNASFSSNPINSSIGLNCSFNQLTNLDVSNVNGVIYLNCSDNQITNLNIGNKEISVLNCSNNLISELAFVNCLKAINIDGNANNPFYPILNLSNNKLTKLTFSGNNVLENLDCSFNLLTELDMNSVSAPINFNLLCNNNKLNKLELPIDSKVIWPGSQFNFSNNELTTIDFKNFDRIRYLYISHNQLQKIDLSKLQFDTPENFDCSYNNISEIVMYKNVLNSNWWEVNLSHNQLTNLDLFERTNKSGYQGDIDELDVSYNQLQNIDFTLINIGQIRRFYLSSNPFKILDFSSVPLNKMLLSGMYVENCENLEMLNFKNGIDGDPIYSVIVKNCPKLKYVCVDESKTKTNEAEYYNFSNCNCSTNIKIGNYCSFTPGGEYYTLNGTQRLDLNNDGCDASDIVYPNLKFNIAKTNEKSSFITDDKGEYQLYVPSGNYTITPVLENSTYFTISPVSLTANFPTQTSPLTQDICITPNGVHHDVEAVLIPLGNAVPGFEANYQLVFKNKGNQTESGQITLSFDDTLMDFVSASVTPLKVENGLLTFEYADLKPFEKDYIGFNFILNKPTDIPALNAGMILSFLATITGGEPEETIYDNSSALRQIVVNSYDPNDKTCLEGNTVTPELVGQYVHYVVRFENTGTLEARNIVVKDMIDTAKFDVNSLIVTNSSHSCVTKVSETNKVEFIFENINLPFDNATNDGYIAFKIKTLPSLVVGDTFSNTADIFFDYNFPITTNEAKTTVEVLSTNDFAFENYFSLYPNPAKNNLTLNTKNSIEVKNINVFNTLGQLVLSIPNAQTVSNFDVSRLNTGTYFVKIVTNKGTSTTKFIKE